MRRTERAAAALLVSLGLGAAAMPAGAQTLRRRWPRPPPPSTRTTTR
ncbi:hypothetical protein [Teichococcus aestuarii]